MKHDSFTAALKRDARLDSDYPFSIISSPCLIQLAREHGLELFEAQSICLDKHILPERYLRNFSSISFSEQKKLADSQVLLVGLGGLGGYILEILGRAGVGGFVLADGDCFEDSNLNRQILATVDTIEKPKVIAAKVRLESVNPFCRIQTARAFLKAEDLPGLVKDVHLVVDALGGVEFRLVLLRETSRCKIPLVTGFVAGNTGLASTVYPGGKSPAMFWQGKNSDGAETVLGNTAPMVSLIASVQSQEAIRILSGKESGLSDRVFMADFETMSFELLKL